MKLKELLDEIGKNYQESELDTLEQWLGNLVFQYATLCTEIGEAKRDRAAKEVSYKADLIEAGGKPTEKEIERMYYSSVDGSALAYNQELVKAVGRWISAIRFRIDALRGNIR